jgi:pimeloyl-ACP methyl ester carboxylesterase
VSEITLIIHGWSDSSASFRRLKDFLIGSGIGDVRSIRYADYESREDNITFDDVVDGLNDRLQEQGIIGADGAKKHDLNVIVHSTGGLVIRHWIWRYYYRDGNRIGDCPVKRLVMLAPANFGSPLAHRGKSFFGSLFKGQRDIDNLFEVGRGILTGLELASPYQWTLAHRDILIDSPYYTAEQTQTTIFVGIKDYRGLRKWVNKEGTDGTVVIAGTSLDTAKLTLDFCKPRAADAVYTPYEWAVDNPPDDFAFGVLEGLNHSSIVKEIAPGANNPVSQLLLQALKTNGVADFQRLQVACVGITDQTYENEQLKPDPGDRTKPYQQFLVHAVDDQGVSISDFNIEFFLFKSDERITGGVAAKPKLTPLERHLSDDVHDKIAQEFHRHSEDPSYRRFLVCPSEVGEFLQKARLELDGPVALAMRIDVPRIDQGIQYAVKDLQCVVVIDQAHPQAGAPHLFYENTTTLLELRINRYNTYVTISQEPRKH